MLESISILKFIAAVLIVNSHMDSIYPISSLATGGAIGNSIFFAVSGYCLANIKLPFMKWYGKRVSRVYPGVFIVTLILIGASYLTISKPSDIFFYFIYPTYYWFIGAIVIFYILYYILYCKGYNTKLNCIVALFMAVIYLFTYLFVIDTSTWTVEENIVCKYIFYFLMMMFGVYIKARQNKEQEIKHCVIKLITAIFIYFGFKFAIDLHPYIMRLQFLTQVLTFPIVYYLFLLLLKNEKKLSANGGVVKKYLMPLVNYIGGLTLEIYLVHIPVLYYMPKVLFPINFILFVAITMVLASLLQIITKFIDKLAAKLS